MNFRKLLLLGVIALNLSLGNLFAEDLEINIATIDVQGALLSTDVAKKEIEELQNSKEWKEVAEELQSKVTEAREIQEKTQKEGPTMSDEEKQDAANSFQSLSQDINFLREKQSNFQRQVFQLISQQQAEKFQIIVTELIRAKGITLLLDRGQQSLLLHSDQSYDVTEEVIKAMNEKED
mgnify:FL=1|tara:strand:- start:122821 stop:123357 length:537 start_codon:yes stop_codon:yes gene_type:complete